MLAKGNPEGGPEDPRNAPVVAAILRNPNRMRNAESPSPDIAACSPGPARASFHTYVFDFRRVFRDQGRKSEWRVALVPQSPGGVKRRCRFCIPMVVPEDIAYDIWKRLTPDMVARGHGLGCNRWGDKQYKARNVRGCRPLQRAERLNSDWISPPR